MPEQTKIIILQKASQLTELFEHGRMIRFKDDCILVIFKNQVVLWDTSGIPMAWVDITNNTFEADLLTVADFEDYLDGALEE